MAGATASPAGRCTAAAEPAWPGIADRLAVSEDLPGPVSQLRGSSSVRAFIGPSP